MFSWRARISNAYTDWGARRKLLSKTVVATHSKMYTHTHTHTHIRTSTQTLSLTHSLSHTLAAKNKWLEVTYIFDDV
jgi:hypothetical protein